MNILVVLAALAALALIAAGLALLLGVQAVPAHVQVAPLTHDQIALVALSVADVPAAALALHNQRRLLLAVLADVLLAHSYCMRSLASFACFTSPSPLP